MCPAHLLHTIYEYFTMKIGNAVSNETVQTKMETNNCSKCKMFLSTKKAYYSVNKT